MPWISGIHRVEGVKQGAFHSPLNSGIFFIKSNGMNRFSLVGLTGVFTWNTCTDLAFWLVGYVPFHLTKILIPSTTLLHPAYNYNNQMHAF